MCGIAGFVPQSPLPAALWAQVSQALAHRGPDDEGWMMVGPEAVTRGRAIPVDGTVDEPLLLHRRLAIVDLSEAGAQPMASADGRYLIAYNGEVYNHAELRARLEAEGVRFRSSSDTEVVLEAYARWGPAAFGRFVGMFALAIVDRKRREVVLARDPFGIKPLFYASTGHGAVFGSELDAVLQVPGVSREAHLDRVYAYLTASVGATSPAGSTFFSHVHQVPAGTSLRIPFAGAPETPQAFWTPPKRASRDDYDTAVAKVREHFLDNVRLHLRSDVPVGVCLSGGIDSSSILGAMRKVAGPRAEIHAVGYVATDPTLSEARWMALAAEHAGATLHEVRPDDDGLLLDLPDLVRRQGEPFPTTSMYAQYRVFAAARAAGLKVMLDGQGADEILAGYRYFYPARLASLLAAGRWIRAVRFARAVTRRPGVHAGALWSAALQRFVPRAWLRAAVRAGLAGRQFRPSWLRGAWFRRRGVHPEVARRPARHGLREELWMATCATSLPALLRYEDRNSMASSVESRVPFLTTEFVEYLLSLPEEFHIGPDGTTKRVLRDAMRGLVPDAILDRQDKVGFATSERQWLIALDPWVQRVLASPAAASLPFLDAPAMLEHWSQVRSGAAPYDPALWRVLNLVVWAETFGVRFDGTTVADPTPLQAPRPIPVRTTRRRPAPSPMRAPPRPSADPAGGA